MKITFWVSGIIGYTCHSKFTTFIDLKKWVFSKITQFLNVFENSCHFSRILRETCYNLVIKNLQILNRPIWTFCLDNLQVNVKRNAPRWVNDFPSIFLVEKKNWLKSATGANWHFKLMKNSLTLTKPTSRFYIVFFLQISSSFRCFWAYFWYRRR